VRFRKLKTVDPELGKVTAQSWVSVWGQDAIEAADRL